MAIGIATTGIHHVALRSTDLARARRFYADTSACWRPAPVPRR